MAHFFVPRGESASMYDETTDAGFLHAWKLTIGVGMSGKIGLWGGYDQGKPLSLTSNNPGVITFDEPQATLASGDRFIRIRGNSAGYTMLEAGNSNATWCSLQVHVLPQLHTPSVPQWRFYQMSWEYYNKVAKSEMTEREFRQRWHMRNDEYENLIGMFRRSNLNREYWDKHQQATAMLQTNDFLVIGEGGIVTLNSNYGLLVLGSRLSSIQPKTGIGSIAGAVAKIFTSDPNLIGAIESTGDLIEIGLSGFAVVRTNSANMRPQKLPNRTALQNKIIGDAFRDRVAAEVRRMHEGTGYTVDIEVEFETTAGKRRGDVVLRDPAERIVCVLECKAGKGLLKREQAHKDNILYQEQDIRTIKVTQDFFFVPE